MLPASNRGVGMNMGFPDVCNTPVGPATAPIPYPNMAMNAQAVGFSPVVKISGVNGHNMATQIPMTTGDEAGHGSPDDQRPEPLHDGQPHRVHRQDARDQPHVPHDGHHMNNALGAVLVPSAVNVMFCRRSETDMLEASITASTTLPGGVVHARLASINPGAATEMFSATRHARAVIVDLRGCPGGALDAAEALIDFFAATTLPVVVMIDGGTASAAELVAARLQASGATVVGRRSYGKTYGRRSDGATVRWSAKRIKPDVSSSAVGEALLRLAWGLALRR